MRWALIAVFTLLTLGAWGMGLTGTRGLSAEVQPSTLPKVAMRALPELTEPAAPVAVAMKAPEAPPRPEPAPPAARPEPAPPAPKPAAAQPKPAAAQPKPAAAPKPAPAQPKAEPEPAQPKPEPEPAPEEKETSAAPPPAAPAASGEGTVDLKASDTAEVVVDGRKVGPSPKLGLKLKAGKHKVRFDCYDENGTLKPGKVQTIELAADEERTIDYECPATE